MPGITRLGDSCTGHAHCFPPSPTVAASSDVIVNGSGAVRVGDAYAIHGSCSDHSPHGGAAAAGSGTVIVNGSGVHRIGDSRSCGGAASGGSGDVIAG